MKKRIEKGPFFKAGELLKTGPPKIDLHMHTTWTDGKCTAEEMIQRAKDLGLKEIAFTEHLADRSKWYERFMEHKSYYKSLCYPMKYYQCGEVKLADINGRLDLEESKIKSLDFLVGVLHRFPNEEGGYWSFQKLSAEKAMLLDYELSKILLKNPLVDVFGHPSGVFSQFFGEYDRDMLRELIDFAVENDKIIELNAGMRYRKVFDIILERCLELDCYISIGSDAHHIDELGLAYNLLKQEIKRFN